jgi:hypothetical protein
MGDSKDETGKGASRPYARLDLKATEVDGKPSASGKATRFSVPNPFAAAQAFLRDQRRTVPLLTHLAAGLLGGALAALALLAFSGPREGEGALAREVAPLTGRVAELERTVARQATAPDWRGRVDGLARATGALEAASSKHAGDLKSLQERLANPAAGTAELAARLAKLESAIAALSVSGSGEANEAARAGLERFAREVANAKAEASRVANRFDGLEQQLRTAQGAGERLKGELERGLKGTASSEDLSSLRERLAALDKEFQELLKTEAPGATLVGCKIHRTCAQERADGRRRQPRSDHRPHGDGAEGEPVGRRTRTGQEAAAEGGLSRRGLVAAGGDALSG